MIFLFILWLLSQFNKFNCLKIKAGVQMLLLPQQVFYKEKIETNNPTANKNFYTTPKI